MYKETVGPLKEVAVWTQEKYYTRRKNRILSPTGIEHDDALGLSVEGNELKLPEERLQGRGGRRSSAGFGWTAPLVS